MLTLYGKHIAGWSLPSSKHHGSEKAGVSEHLTGNQSEQSLYKQVQKPDSSPGGLVPAQWRTYHCSPFSR